MKTFLTVLALCIASASFAQIEKGRSYLNGQIGGSSQKETYDNPNYSGPDKQGSFSVSAGYGYLVGDKWAVGLSLGVDLSKFKYTSSTVTIKETNYRISPYVRRYFPLAEKLYIQIDGAVGFSYGKDESTSVANAAATTNEQKIASLSLSPGLTYFLFNRFALSTSLGSLYFRNWKQTSSTPLGGSTQKSFGVSFGLSSVSLGASIFF